MQSKEQNWQAASEFDYAFHQHIIELSHNQSIIQTLKIHTEWIKRVRSYPLFNPIWHLKPFMNMN